MIARFGYCAAKCRDGVYTTEYILTVVTTLESDILETLGLDDVACKLHKSQALERDALRLLAPRGRTGPKLEIAAVKL